MPVPKGKRYGGKPKGYKAPTTLTKEMGRELVRQLVIAELEPMTKLQIVNAKGLRHTFMRDKGGKFVLLTDPKDIEVALNSGDEGKYYWTFTKDPSIQAYTDLMNRALDKPKEQPVEVTVTKGTTTLTDDELEERAIALLDKLKRHVH